ncbi:MAG: cytidine deaminase [Pirellulales bacterium]
MNNSDRDELIRAAFEAQQRAYCPYSDYPVGAALRTASGKIYHGVNIENASFGLTICAERVAASAAVAAGEREFTEIAVVSRGGVSPCGACRQFLAEFNPSLPIVMIDSLQPQLIREASLADLLPGRFEGPV